MLINKLWSLVLLITMTLLSSNVHAGGGDDPDYDLILSGVIERDNPLTQQEESQMIRYFANRWFYNDRTSEEQHTFSSLLKKINNDIKKIPSDIELKCERMTDDSCVLLGTTVELEQFYYIDQWSACVSNTTQSAHSYILDTVKHSQLNDDDIKKLISRRLLQLFDCQTYQDPLTGPFINEIDSPYYDYLYASNSLYKDDYSTTVSKLKLALTKSTSLNENAWLSEAIPYTLGRASLLLAQKDWEGWSYWNEQHEDLDEQEILTAIDFLQQYIDQYPNGQWVNSALGLISRAHYFLKLIDSDHEDFKGRLENTLMSEIKNYAPEKRSTALSNVFYDFSKIRDIDHIEFLTIFEALLSEQAEHEDLINLQVEVASYLKLVKGDESINNDKIASFKSRDIFSVFLAEKYQKSGNVKGAINVLLQNKEVFNYSSDVNVLIAKYLEKHNGIADVINFPSYLSDKYYDGPSVIQELYLGNTCDYTDIQTLIKNNFNHNGDYSFNPANEDLFTHTLIGYYLQTGYLDKAVGLAKTINNPKLPSVDLTRLDFNNLNVAKNHLIMARWISKHWSARYCRSIKGEEGETKKVYFAYRYLLSGLAKAREERNHKLIPEILHILTLCARIGSRGYECGSNYKPSSKNYKSSKHWFRLLHKNYPNSVWADRTPYNF